MKNLILILVLQVVFINSALAAPAQVLIIRHAEKINDELPQLSNVGYQRAQTLVDFFINNASVNAFGPPVAIFAAVPKNANGSIRPYETVAPLATALQMSVILDFEKDDFKKVKQAILENSEYDGKTVLLSWVNDEIPKLAKKLGADTAPTDWDSNTFDRVWKLSFDANENVTFENIPMGVMPGDSN